MQDPDIVLYQHDHFKPLVDRAIKLTEEYVSKHKLILTGGMAIDLALRAKGESIYADDAIPDYDIISDQNLMHANALAEILCNDGMPDIRVINAFHVTTLRVYMKKTVLLDATYIPTERFKQIPYLDVDHLRVVHPHYQFIDQRLSLSNLLNDTGISLNVFNRLKKDMHRNALLRQMYPIESTFDMKSLKYKHLSIPLDLIVIDIAYLTQIDENAVLYTGSTCVAGYVALMLYSPNAKWSLTDSSLEIDIPEDMHARFLCCDINQVAKYIKNPTMYRPLINIKPATQVVGDFEFADTYGARIGCNILKLSDKVHICVASVDYILMELLRDRIYVNEEPYSKLYSDFVDIVDKMRETESELKWWPSLDCYGFENFPEAKILMLERIMDPTSFNNLKPRNSYPSPPKCLTRDNFVPEDSHYFRMDGTMDKSLKHTNYKYVLDEFRHFVDKKREDDHSN